MNGKHSVYIVGVINQALLAKKASEKCLTSISSAATKEATLMSSLILTMTGVAG